MNGEIGCDYVALADKYRRWDNNQKLGFLRRSSLEETSSEEKPNESSAVTNTKIAVVWNKKNMKMKTNGQLISAVPELKPEIILNNFNYEEFVY